MSQRGGGKPFFKENEKYLKVIGLPKALITKVAKDEHLDNLEFGPTISQFAATSNQFAKIYNSTQSQRTDGRPFPEIRWDCEKLKFLLAKMIAIYKYCSGSDETMKDMVVLSMQRVIKYNAIYWNDMDQYMNNSIPFQLPPPPSSLSSSDSLNSSSNTAGGKKTTKAPAKKSK